MSLTVLEREEGWKGGIEGGERWREEGEGRDGEKINLAWKLGCVTRQCYILVPQLQNNVKEFVGDGGETEGGSEVMEERRREGVR